MTLNSVQKDTHAESVGGIEQQLTTSMLRSASNIETPIVRARTMNLVVRGDSPPQREHAAFVLSHLAESQPSRAIMLVSDDQPSRPDIDAKVEAHFRNVGDKLVCYEQIFIDTHGASGAHLAAVVEPLLVSHLPTCLWWVGDPDFSHDVFEQLAMLSDRLIVDSQCFNALEADLTELQGCLGRSDLIVTDLNWERTVPWRTLIAQLFGGDEGQLHLSGITRVTVYTTGTHTVQALLLMGWLASRLAWQIESDGTAEAACVTTADHRQPVDLGIEIGTDSNDAIRRVLVETNVGGGLGQFDIECHGDQMTASMCGAGLSDLCVKSRCHQEVQSDLILAGLSHRSRDHTFVEAVGAARALLFLAAKG